MRGRRRRLLALRSRSGESAPARGSARAPYSGPSGARGQLGDLGGVAASSIRRSSAWTRCSTSGMLVSQSRIPAITFPRDGGIQIPNRGWHALGASPTTSSVRRRNRKSSIAFDLRNRQGVTYEVSGEGEIPEDAIRGIGGIPISGQTGTASAGCGRAAMASASDASRGPPGSRVCWRARPRAQ
jgi:hypothetical protein